MTSKQLKSSIDKTLLKLYIYGNEEVSAEEYAMNKKDKILKDHTSNVYPILQMKKGAKQVYYTKLDPDNRNHNRLIYSGDEEVLKDKILAYYLNIECNSKLTVGDVLELSILELNADTAERHVQIFKKHFSNLKNIKISKLKEEDIRDSLQKMLDEGIKAKAFNNATSTLNKISDYCVYNHIDCINIRDKIAEFRKYKLVGKHVFKNAVRVETDLAFDEDEAVDIIHYALSNSDYHNLAIAALITTGLRAGELLALTLDDVNLTSRRIRANKMENTRSYDIIDHCKDNSERYVYLNEDAWEIFRILLDKRYKEESDSPYVFLNSFSDDGKMHLRALDNRIRKIQSVLHLDDDRSVRSCHDCRRTYASIQYLHGVDIKTIQIQLGHSNPNQTWDYIKYVVDSNTRLKTLSKGCILGRQRKATQ